MITLVRCPDFLREDAKIPMHPTVLSREVQSRFGRLFPMLGHNVETHLALRSTRLRTIEQWNKVLRTDNPQYLATFKQLSEGLRNAGMPEN